MRFTSSGAAAAALVLLLLSACPTGGAPTQKKEAPADDEIIIGVAGPMSGDLGEFGKFLGSKKDERDAREYDQFRYADASKHGSIISFGRVRPMGAVTSLNAS